MHAFMHTSACFSITLHLRVWWHNLVNFWIVHTFHSHLFQVHAYNNMDTPCASRKKSLWIANLNLLCMIIIDSGQDNRNEVCIVNKPKLVVHDRLQRTSLLGIPHELIFHLCSTHVKTIPQISAIFVCHHCQN